MEALKPFDYFEPQSVDEAVRLLCDHGATAYVLAGGVDLIPRLRKGKITASCLVNIQKISELTDIVATPEGLKFGAMTKLLSLEKSEAIQKNFSALYDSIHQITSVQAKTMGTAVGNICVGTPASDVATALFVLDAELIIAGLEGERKESITDFCVGYACTSLQAHEIVKSVFIPFPRPGTGMAFMNLVRTHSDIAKVSVAAAITLVEGVCVKARIAIGAAAPTVFRARDAEDYMQDKKIDTAVINQAAAMAASETKTISDLRSTAEYRKETAGILVRRVLEKASQQVAA